MNKYSVAALGIVIICASTFLVQGISFAQQTVVSSQATEGDESADTVIVDALIKVATNKEDDKDVRILAVDVLSKFRETQRDKIVQAFAGVVVDAEDDKEVRITVIEAIEKLRRPFDTQ